MWTWTSFSPYNRPLSIAHRTVYCLVFHLFEDLGGNIAQLDSVWQYCFAIIRCFRMNGIDPLLTTFVSYCVEVQRPRADVWKWLFDSLSHPRDPSLCVSSPWECHASLLHFEMVQKVPLFSLFFRRTQNCSRSPCCKRYLRPGPGSQVQRNLA